MTASLTRSERHEKSIRFRAEIARRAELVVPKPSQTYFIPNAPLGQPKLKAPPPPPLRNVEPDYWHQMWFHDLVFGRPRNVISPLKIEDIYQATANEFGISKIDLMSMRRTKDVVLPRHIAIYLAKVMTGRSFPEIARRMNGRDHSTAIHSFKKIELEMQTDMELAARIEKIKAALR